MCSLAVNRTGIPAFSNASSSIRLSSSVLLVPSTAMRLIFLVFFTDMCVLLSLGLQSECHGAQAEAQIPNPLGGSVQIGRENKKIPSHHERFLRRPYCCQWPHPWTTVARSRLVGETYASLDAVRNLKMWRQNTIYMSDYKKEWHRKTVIE